MNPVVKIEFQGYHQIIDFETVLSIVLVENKLTIMFKHEDHTVEVSAGTDTAQELIVLYADLYTKWRKWREWELSRRYAYIDFGE